MSRESEARKRFSIESKKSTEEFLLAVAEYKLEEDDEVYGMFGKLYAIDSKVEIFLKDTVTAEYIQNAFKEGIKKGVMDGLELNLTNVVIDYDKLASAVITETGLRKKEKEPEIEEETNNHVFSLENLVAKIKEPIYLVPITAMTTALIINIS